MGRARKYLSARLRDTFLSGLLVVFPLFVCIVVAVWLLRTAEAIFGALPKAVLPHSLYFPGLGILIAIAIIFLVGAFLHAWLIGRVIEGVGSLFNRIPLIKTLYQGARDLLGFFSHGGGDSELKQAVLVELQPQVFAIGFVTNDDARRDFQALTGHEEGERMVAVYLQMGYQVGGYTLYVPASRVRPLNIPVDEALRVVLTAHVTRPEKQSPTQ
ncbi:MAG: DUF502 domain-containing protein [Salinisphaera sp.]|nr:DUF502 domain-containing protein [Salinisphaera sp.]